jgi:7-keto-8-aminopelargonate synthetase-like enzyme
MRQNLSDDEHVIAAALDGLSRHFFGTAVTIHLSGVNKGHAEIETEFERRHLVGPVGANLTHPICA